MQSISKLLAVLIEECSHKCSTDYNWRDAEVVNQRLAHEGLSFLTITLPTFLDTFMSCVEEGRVTSDHFVGWKKRQCLPAFLQGFTSLVFDYNGRILDEPSSTAVRSIRQICNLFKKIKMACSKEREAKAFQSYMAIEQDLAKVPCAVSKNSLVTFDRVSGIIVSEVFGQYDSTKILPHHGPGSTAEKLQGNQKYSHEKLQWPERLNGTVWMDETLYPNSLCCANDTNTNIPELSVRDETPVRVISVPKTQKTPRIIAMEPVAMQMVQQGIKDAIVPLIEQSRLTGGKVNFTRQSINQDLARIASINKKMATLDLSAASDRVHKHFIWRMLKANKPLRQDVFNTRSRFGCVPLGAESTTIRLRKFASMGSALCFPMEALYFFTLLVCSRITSRNLPVNARTVRKYSRDVYVYGDDIIIPSDEVDAAVCYLEDFGNKVGKDKSFWRGPFRESCGMDAFNGDDVTPVYLRVPLPSGKRVPASDAISIVSTANLLYSKGLNKTASLLKDVVEEKLGNLPSVHTTCAGLGWHFKTNVKRNVRFNRRLQRVEVKTFVPQLSLKKDSISGYAALTKCLLNLERKKASALERSFSLKAELIKEQSISKDHLDFSASLGVLTLKRRWVHLGKLDGIVQQ